MNTSKLIYAISAIIIAGIMIYSGCGGDDSTTPTTSYPTINMTQGSVYFYNNDTGGSIPTSFRTKDSVLSTSASIGGQICIAISDSTMDTLGGLNVPISGSTQYVYYDGAGGKFYQWGVLNIFLNYLNTSVTPKWDVVADFSVTSGNSWTIESNDTVTVNGSKFLVTLSGVNKGTTTNNTTDGTIAVNCYHIEITAAISLLVGGVPLGNATYEYYLGYASSASNPSGLMKLLVNPVHIAGFGSTGGFRNIDHFKIQ